MLKPILIALMFFTASCSNNQPKEVTKETQPPVTETNQSKLQLNNGEKWKMDEATRQNMEEINAYISQATHTKVLNVDKLQNDADNLIKESGMSGPGYNALQTWLGTFSQHLQAIKNNRDAESASHALTEDVKVFYTYFE